jgi:hypothetical protein
MLTRGGYLGRGRGVEGGIFEKGITNVVSNSRALILLLLSADWPGNAMEEREEVVGGWGGEWRLPGGLDLEDLGL